VVTNTVNNQFISRLSKRITRMSCVALRQHITVSFDHSTVSNYRPHDKSASNESELRAASTVASVRPLRLAKGWYMLEVSGNGHTIGSNLSVSYSTDDSKVSENVPLKNPLEFNILLGSHALSKRIIRIDSPTRSVDFVLDIDLELDELPIVSFARVSSQFAAKRMRNKLIYASSRELTDRFDEQKNSDEIYISELFEVYNRLMERHINPVTLLIMLM